MAMLGSALLWFVVAAAVAAPATPKCSRPSKGENPAPPNLKAVMACQQSERKEFYEKHRKTHGGQEPSATLSEEFDDRQRSEVREFIRKNPEAATIEGDDAEEKGGEAAGKDSGGAAGKDDDGIMGQLGALFGIAKDKLDSMFGGGKKAPEAAAPKKIPTAKELKKVHPEAAAALETVMDGAAKGGLDLKNLSIEQLQEQMKNDPAAAVRGAASAYNKKLQEAMDPDIQSFYEKGDGAKSRQKPAGDP